MSHTESTSARARGRWASQADDLTVLVQPAGQHRGLGVLLDLLNQAEGVHGGAFDITPRVLGRCPSLAAAAGRRWAPEQGMQMRTGGADGRTDVLALISEAACLQVRGAGRLSARGGIWLVARDG